MVEVERGTWRINFPSFQRLIVIRIKVVVYSFWTVNMEVELPPHHLQSLILSSRVYRDGSECVTLVNNKARHFLLIACVLSVQLLIKYPTGWEKKSIIPTISWLCKGFFLMCIHWKKTKRFVLFHAVLFVPAVRPWRFISKGNNTVLNTAVEFIT